MSRRRRAQADANLGQGLFIYIYNTFKDCTVRREKVLEAITWLKHNNPYYADIEIDQEALQQLPVHGEVGVYIRWERSYNKKGFTRLMGL